MMVMPIQLGRSIPVSCSRRCFSGDNRTFVQPPESSGSVVTQLPSLSVNKNGVLKLLFSCFTGDVFCSVAV